MTVIATDDDERNSMSGECAIDIDGDFNLLVAHIKIRVE
jgi:hypothetical protein